METNSLTGKLVFKMIERSLTLSTAGTAILSLILFLTFPVRISAQVRISDSRLTQKNKNKKNRPQITSFAREYSSFSS